jgi:SAM-dependent methyltransferase
MTPVDFSRGAGRYDGRHGARLAPGAAAQLADTAGLGKHACILDLGAGTGRVAVALAALGHRVFAVDVAQAMLQLLRKKAAGLPVHAIAAEGARLPFAAARFDAIVLARVLYLMPDWQEIVREAIRTVSPDGRLLHEWGNGEADEEWVQLREKARALFESAGVARPFHPGVRTEADVERCLAREGWRQTAAVRLGPGPGLTLAGFLARVVDGECSYTWNVPADVQARCLPELRAWAEAQFDLGRERPIPREMIWRVYER